MTAIAWVSVLAGLTFCAVSIGFVVLIAVRALQSVLNNAETYVNAHMSTLRTLETIHDRNMKQLDSVLDRFMSLDFQLFKAYQGEETMEGGFEAPEEGEPTGTVTYTPGGGIVVHGADFLEEMRRNAEEEQILAEDFSDEFLRSEDNK